MITLVPTLVQATILSFIPSPQVVEQAPQVPEVQAPLGFLFGAQRMERIYM